MNFGIEHIVDAVAARIETDLRTGAAFTRFLTLFLRNGFAALKTHVISYGRLFISHASRFLSISDSWFHR